MKLIAALVEMELDERVSPSRTSVRAFSMSPSVHTHASGNTGASAAFQGWTGCKSCGNSAAAAFRAAAVVH